MNPCGRRTKWWVGGLVLVAAPLWADSAAIDLPGVWVHSTRVANQEPTGTIAMPISGLRFEPQVDVQARNLAEGQADVSIRGGTFANTGFRVAALPLYDPQTGHYSAEIPIAPELLTPPRIATGAEHARSGWNASVGSIAYGWRPIRTGGHISASAGDFSTFRGESHAAVATAGGFGVDVAWAHSVSDGSVRFGDHEFNRANVRLQQRTPATQTDVFAGYQSKFFGWPNLYTPFGSPETENLQTVLLAASHRREWGNDDFIELGAYHRRHKDDYAFNRFAPVGPVHPFQHTTWVTGAGLTGRRAWHDPWYVSFRVTALADEIESTSLIHGRFSTRSYGSAGLFPEWRRRLESGGTLMVSAGASWDQTNRDGSTFSPVVEVAHENLASSWHRWALSYARSSQVPDYTALNSNPAAGLFRGNSGLGRATTHNIEMSGAFTAGGWNGSVAGFVRRDEDLVDWTFRRGVTARLARAVDIDTMGLEVFASRSWGRWEVTLGYTWLEKDEDYGSALVDGSFYALNYPKHRMTAAVVARLGSGWELRFDNEARLQADNPLRQVGGDEALISALGLYWRVPDVPGLQLSLQVDNLWNANFEEVPAVPAGRRLVMGGVRWQW
jgi:vitamin B12 transporter